MLVLGFDVAILMLLGAVLTIIALAVSCVLRMTQLQGDICVSSVFITSLAYVIAYIVMTMVLDRLV